MRILWLLPCLLLGAPAAASTADTAPAAKALAEWTRLCDSEGQLLWRKSLCGPMVLVDPGTRAAIANHPDPEGKFRQDGAVYTGVFPERFTPSNTSIQWSGQQWSTVMLPLPAEPFQRLSLLAHESFHRIQGALGLNASDAANAQLDTEVGRLWLRLELRALARAMRTEGPAGRQNAADAMLFRLYRHRLCAGSEAAEAAMEKQEGLAEYTGVSIALRATGELVAREARVVETYEDSNAFARSFAYATGPALGILLDRYSAGWRTRVAATSLDSLLTAALHVRPPAALEHTARQRAALYGYSAVAAAEREREARHQAYLSDLQTRFIDGPTLDFPSEPEMQRNFNPQTLVPFPPHGTYYPTGVFSANWGRLQVEAGGALLAPDNQSVRVPPPAGPLPAVPNAQPVNGPGWVLKLAPGWTIQPASRPGSFAVVHAAQ